MAVTETPVVPPQPSVFVDRSVGEYLFYKITALGSKPVFTLADNRGRTIMTSQGVPPQMTYTRKWPKSADDDPVPRRNEHAIIGLMGLVTQYTYEVEHRSEDDAVIEKVIHSVYKRVAPFDDTDQFRRVLAVRIGT